MRGAVITCVTMLAGCATPQPAGLESSGKNAVAAAVIGTALGLTAAAVSRASGGCYAACPSGTACNEKTGLCDPLPCRGLCREDEVCDDTLPEPRCMPGKPVPPSTVVSDSLFRPSGPVDPLTGEDRSRDRTVP